jgi:hypothetical protein
VNGAAGLTKISLTVVAVEELANVKSAALTAKFLQSRRREIKLRWVAHSPHFKAKEVLWVGALLDLQRNVVGPAGVFSEQLKKLPVRAVRQKLLSGQKSGARLPGFVSDRCAQALQEGFVRQM